MSINKIIHISKDEKFINSARWQFESIADCNNEFYILVKNTNTPLKHVDKVKSVFLIDDLNPILNKIAQSDILVFHSLDPDFYQLIRKLPLNIKCIWMCFGFEIYNDSNYISQKKILAKQTYKALEKKKNNFKRVFKEALYPYHRFLFKSDYYSRSEIKKLVISRMDYLCSTYKEEFEEIQSLINLKKKYFAFTYYPLEKIVDVNEQILTERPNVLIGNSGFNTSNHRDAFSKIKDYNLHDKKVIAPLAYGNKNYINEIIDDGKRLFGDNFLPLTSFQELKKYNEVLKTCGISIFYNYRQQAIGNTISSLWFGSKIFFNENNTFYKFLKRIGLIVYNFDKELTEESFNTLLSLKEINHNRSILFKYFNSEYLIEELEKQILAIDV